MTNAKEDHQHRPARRRWRCRAPRAQSARLAKRHALVRNLKEREELRLEVANGIRRAKNARDIAHSEPSCRAAQRRQHVHLDARQRIPTCGIAQIISSAMISRFNTITTWQPQLAYDVRLALAAPGAAAHRPATCRRACQRPTSAARAPARHRDGKPPENR
jgi:hypothetical protein